MSEIIDDILLLFAIWFAPLTIIFLGEDINMSDQIIVGLIGGAVTILVFVLKWIFYDRKQYKHVLKMLGKFEGRSLENKIGVGEYDSSLSSQIGVTAGKNSLTLQHEDIKDLLGVETNKKSLSLQLDDIKALLGIENFDNKSISVQNKEIIKVFKKNEKERVEKIKNLNNNQKNIIEKVDALKLFSEDYINVINENSKLKHEVSLLTERLNLIQSENIQIRNEISTSDEENQSEPEI